MKTLTDAMETNELAELSDEQLRDTTGGSVIGDLITALISWLNRESGHEYR